LTENTGYLLVFREKNDLSQKKMETWVSSGSKVQLTKISGHGKNRLSRTSHNGRIKFELAERNTWAMYFYRVKK
jgi:alpha-galactosidase